MDQQKLTYRTYLDEAEGCYAGLQKLGDTPGTENIAVYLAAQACEDYTKHILLMLRNEEYTPPNKIYADQMNIQILNHQITDIVSNIQTESHNRIKMPSKLFGQMERLQMHMFVAKYPNTLRSKHFTAQDVQNYRNILQKVYDWSYDAIDLIEQNRNKIRKNEIPQIESFGIWFDQAEVQNITEQYAVTAHANANGPKYSRSHFTQIYQPALTLIQAPRKDQAEKLAEYMQNDVYGITTSFTGGEVVEGLLFSSIKCNNQTIQRMIDRMPYHYIATAVKDNLPSDDIDCRARNLFTHPSYNVRTANFTSKRIHGCTAMQVYYRSGLQDILTTKEDVLRALHLDAGNERQTTEIGEELKEDDEYGLA